MKCLVTGAGGMIGGHLVKSLRDDGHKVRAVDIKPLRAWEQVTEDVHVENIPSHDLRLRDLARQSMYGGMDRVYNLAADMGGIGYITGNHAACMQSVLINTHLLQAAAGRGVERYFYSSSACVYPMFLQTNAEVTALREDDVFPAAAETGYGEEKLFSEQMCRYFREDLLLETRIARFHNVYADFTEYKGGREKAPAAICRKVAEAKLTGATTIDIWGDGEQTRSFMWIGDCIDGIKQITEADYHDPLNLGSDEMVTINQLVDLVSKIAGVQLEKKYDLSAPQGVRGRNSDNTLIEKVLGWSPSTPLKEGLAHLYPWVEEQVARDLKEKR